MSASVAEPRAARAPADAVAAPADVRLLDRVRFDCLMFVKAPSSWHMVSPMTGTDPSILRRTLTINIEST